MKQIKSIVASKLLLLILLLALILRLVNLEFPVLTVEEARIASRANFLVSHGTDELDRKFPFVFNSAYDYQLPLTSYITAFGVLIFGKTDLGLRIPFILIGVLIVALTYLVTKILFNNKLALLSASIAAFSPGLIFFSKIPNEYTVLTTLILILIFLLLQKSINRFFIIAVIILMLLTSKLTYFFTMPIVFLTLFLRHDLKKKEKINLILLASIPTIIMVAIFSNIPQGIRSLTENNFAIVSDISIKNGIDRLRGQQIEGWPTILDRLLLNKSFLIIASFFHWVSLFQPSYLFGQLDSSGKFGFLNQGGLPKIIIIPFIVGLIFLIKKGSIKFIVIFLFVLFLSVPAIFIYPKIEVGISILILPFLILISSLGLIRFSSPFIKIVIIFVAAETIINYFFISAHIKSANADRPIWIKQIVNDVYTYSKETEVFLSDKIAFDLAPFVFWYTSATPRTSYEDNYPYKIIQRDIGAIKMINTNDISYGCKGSKINYFFLSEDESIAFQKKSEVFQNIDVTFEKIYQDSLSQNTVYLIKSPICLEH